MSCQSRLQPHLPVLDMISLDTILSSKSVPGATLIKRDRYHVANKFVRPIRIRLDLIRIRPIS